MFHPLDLPLGLLTIAFCEVSAGIGTTDVYAVVQLVDGKPLHKTHLTTSNGNGNGKWNATERWRTIIHASESRYTLSILLMQDRLFGDTLIGTLLLPLDHLITRDSTPLPGTGGTNTTAKQPVAVWYPLEKLEKGGKPVQLLLSVSFTAKEDVFSWFWSQMAEQETLGPLTKKKVEEIFSSLSCMTPSNELEGLFSYCETINVDQFIQFTRENEELILGKLEPTYQNLPLPGYFIWQSAFLNTSNNLETIVDGKGNQLLPWKGNLPISNLDEDIYVQDRKTGKLVKERIPAHIKTALRMGYTNETLRNMVVSESGQKLLIKASESKGISADSKESVKEISEFIKYHNLDMTIVRDPIESFQSFNEFFYRKFNLSCRPIDSHPLSAVSPADCRLGVFEDIDSAKRLWIKGKDFSLNTLLENDEWESLFQDCSLVIARLAPQDYHRYHFPVNGILGEFIQQGHALYTVNPIAVRGVIDVYGENRRTSVLMESPEFGYVLYISIGATLVGSVVLTSTPGSYVTKGEEHGYFAFGGSTILIFGKQLETLVDMGMRIGVAK